MKLIKTILLVGELVAALASFASAESLKAVVIAPQKATPGEDVFLDSSGSTGDIIKRHWSLSAVPPTAIVLGRKQFDQSDPVKPRLLSFAGVYTVKLIVVSKDGELSETEVVVDLGQPTICPPPIPCPACPEFPPPRPPEPTPIVPVPPTPTPTPTPAPEPGVPAGEFGIAPKVAEIVKGIVDTDKATNAKKLADAADALAAQIAAGTQTDAQGVLVKFGEGIKVLQSPAWSAAAPKFTTAVAVTYGIHKLKLKVGLTGVILDTQGWATLVRECGAGVRYGAGIK